MLDVAWPELMVIGVVALVAIGPKDLPKAMYTLGKWAGKARHMASDMRRAFEQMTYEAELAETHTKASPEAASEQQAVPPTENNAGASAKHDPE